MADHKKKKQSSKHKSPALSDIFQDIDNWPQSWAGDDDDVPVGQLILHAMKAFLNEQIALNRSKNTLKRYGDYLWVLGGEIIRDTNLNEKKVENLESGFLLNYVDESGGPYWHDAFDEQDHDRYDAVCRRFYKYLSNN